MNMVEFMSVAKEILRNSCNQLDDVKAAFRVFDYGKYLLHIHINYYML